MEKSDLDDLIKRYVYGQVSESERMRIEAWLDAIGSYDNTDLELTAEEEERIFRKLSSSLTTVEEIAALKPKRRIRPDQWIIRIAASLLIVAVLSYVAWYIAGPPEYELEVTSKNGVEKVLLTDGSLVWLRGESKILYYEKKDEGARYTTFEGEALFEVAKDPDHPFIVHCGDVKVKVLGTSFSVKTTREFVEVTVLAGKVNLSSATNSEGIDLLPQEKAVYRSDGVFEKFSTNQDEVASLTENTDYNMQFNNMNMKNVFERLESKFNVTVKLTDQTIGKCRITIDLTDRSLDNSLRLVSEVLNLDYSIDRKTVTVSGKGCD